MTFRNIVWKMAKANYKKYVFYYLSNTVTVMIFFMFSTVFFNEEMIKFREEESLDVMLAVPAVALVVFTVFFIHFAHSLFIKKRKQEFALFMTLGMTKRDIAKVLQIENSFILFISLVSGLISGIVFSRLFFMLLMRGIGLETIPFQLNATMFLVTTGLFLIIQLVVVGRSLYLLLYRNLIENLKSDRVSQHLKFESTAFGLFGLFMMIFSIAGLFITAEMTSDAAGYLVFWAIFTYFGLYISLSQFMNLFIKLAKRYNHFYYSNIMYLTNLHYKFHKLCSIIMLISVMLMITIWYSTILLTTYKSLEKEFTAGNPFDLVYFQSDTKNNLPFQEVKQILETKDNKIKAHLTLPVHNYYVYNDAYQWYDNYYIMPLDAFNQLVSKQYTLEHNEFLYFINGHPDELGDYLEEFDEFTFPTIDHKNITFKRKHTLIDHKINYVGSILDCIVVNQKQFEFLKKHVKGFSANIHLINLENWKKGKNEIEQLSKRFISYNKTTPAVDDERIKNVSEEQFFEVESKLLYLKRIQSSYGLEFFITIFLSVIFFIATFILLYLNLFSEIDKEKKVYTKLFKIGITKKELEKMIAGEMKMVFFLPTTIGAILAFLYFLAMMNDAGGILNNLGALLYFFVISTSYFLIQSIFYVYSKRKMVHELTK